MKLENFVNAMGINVIQVIDQIHNTRNDTTNNRVVDADTFINKDWYERRLHNKRNNISSKRLLKQDVKINNLTNTFGKGLKNICITKQLCASSNVTVVENKGSSYTSLNFLFAPTTATAAATITTTTTTITTTLSTPISTVSTTKSAATEQERKYSLIKPVSIPINLEILSKQVRLTSRLVKNSSRHKNIKSRVWKRPRLMKWCSTKEFLSNNVKTYQDACKLVNRSDVVVCTDKKKTRHAKDIEFVNIHTDLETIAFLKPLYT